MTPAERAESEARRRMIARMSREANPPRHNRVIEPADRDQEILERTGLRGPQEDGPINWAALTKA